jgi:small-conductance mechanosensitive channel
MNIFKPSIALIMLVLISMGSTHLALPSASSGLTPQALKAVKGEQTAEPSAQSQEALPASPSAEAVSQENTAVRNFKLFDIFVSIEKAADFLIQQTQIVLSGMDMIPKDLAVAYDNLTEGAGALYVLKYFLLFGLILAVGVICEGLVRRLLLPIKTQMEDAQLTGVWLKGWRFVVYLFLKLLYLSIYMATTFMLYVILIPKGSAMQILIRNFLVYTYYVRVAILIVKAIFSPNSANLRLPPISDATARFLYRWLVSIYAIGLFIVTLSFTLKRMGISDELFFLMYSLVGFATIMLIVGMIWQSRRPVADSLEHWYASENGNSEALPVKLARIWHVPAILYTCGVGLFWEGSLLMEGKAYGGKVLVSLLIVPLFILMDILGKRLLSIATENAVEPPLPEKTKREQKTISGHDSGASDDDDAKRQPSIDRSILDVSHVAPLIMPSYRILMIALLFFAVLKMWGINLPVGLIFTEALFSILVTFILALVTWHVVSRIIDERLKEELPDEDEEMEEGGAGGSRTGTLLLLLRKFILTVLVVMVTMIVLAAIGVNIGPLIAGAGVIGLAIGFGAQTLVKDILSGIFFLIDDAFRVGDYIEIGSNKGSVEQISLRSLQLRHPRGMVQTIPFGGIGTVTNLSRDYIITKLDIRVKYDTDLEKVRKIVKKIYKEMTKEEEYAGVLLDKIKSQGVREMDDSAMIMRIKFKTIPGEQFVIRREVFRRVQEAFQANGIEFAHRNVTVYLPPEVSGQQMDTPNGQAPLSETNPNIDPRIIEAGAAAAIAADEADKQAQTPDAKK